MSSPVDPYKFEKRELRMIAIPIAILLIGSLSYYFYIRYDALRTAKKRAEGTLKYTERVILIRMGKIEATVNALRPMAEYALDDPDAMFEISHHIVDASPLIMGACVAFKADYFPEKGHWYEAYVGYQHGNDTLVSMQLGKESHDYLEMDWFTKGLVSEGGFWSNPYYDNAGGKTHVISYTRPVFNSSGQAVGVIGADVSLDTLASIVNEIELYPHSFCVLTTSDGEILVEPPATRKSKGKYHVFSNTIEGKNLALSVTIYDADMYARLRKSTLFFTLMALTTVISVLFIAYRAIRNLQKLNEVRMKEQHIEDELSIARNIQQSLLPSEEIEKTFKTIEIKGMQIPAKYVGGDLFDYYVRDNKLLFCIGDVSGKGVPAALLMAISHSLFRMVSAHSDCPEKIMEDLNKTISDNNPDIMFITMFLGVMDLDTGVVRYCNAGHNPPIVIQNGQTKYLDTEPSLLLGVELSAEYSANELTLAPGDTLFLYTDGLTEAENDQKEVFGDERALKAAAAFGACPVGEQVERMHEAVRKFVGDAEQSDDFTVLAIRYLHSGNTLVVENDIQELDKLEPFLAKFFEREKVDMSLLPQFDLAIEEAMTNVIMYAYPKGQKGVAELSLEAENGQIHSVLSDSGVPFDPLQLPEANLDVSLEERKIGGLGIHLIKEIMSEVSYEYKDGKNVLRMTYCSKV